MLSDWLGKMTPNDLVLEMASEAIHLYVGPIFWHKALETIWVVPPLYMMPPPPYVSAEKMALTCMFYTTLLM